MASFLAHGVGLAFVFCHAGVYGSEVLLDGV